PNLQLSSPTPAPAPPRLSSFTSSPWDTEPAIATERNGHTSETIGEEIESVDVERERGFWKRLELVQVGMVPEKEGWLGPQKYKVESDKRTGGSVTRRYSDFVWLMDCLVKRYPFRLLPPLPPKKRLPDATFLEQRRKGLQRFISTLVNHPVMKDDGALNVFLTEPNFEAWRKRTNVSTEEESASKKLNPAQEMSIPADLEEKLSVLRTHLPTLLLSYQKMVALAERSLARIQASSADSSRFALSLATLSETIPQSCHKKNCGLCSSLASGLGAIGDSWTKVAEISEKRAMTILSGSIESLKSQRDLYVAFRDLFLRHDKLSKDAVEALRKKVETRQKKVETLKGAQKPGWEIEVDKLIAAIDQDNATIATLLSRRVFVRACMWHELTVVYHSRQAAQATLGWREFGKEELESIEAVEGVWEGLNERLKSMPVE
ncbi:sorting nexin-8, partial [Tremellales sp. Uapishka_1]